MRQSEELPGAKELHDLLTDVRKNYCIPVEVLEKLNRRAIGAKGMPKSVAQLQDPVFIAPRHTLINIINEYMLPEMAKRAGKRLIKFYANIKGVDKTGREYDLPNNLQQAARERPREGKDHILPCYYLFEGMELCFVHGNLNMDLDWITNSSCKLRTVVFDQREPPDPGGGDYWELEYIPHALVVETESSSQAEEIAEKVPHGCFPVLQSTESGPLKIPTHLRGNAAGAASEMYIRRRGFHVIPVVAATSYFEQGNTEIPPREVVLDLRIPLTGGISPAVPYVSTSRPKTLEQIYLLHALWTTEAEKQAYLQKAAEVYKYDADTIAVMQFLAEQTEKTKAVYPDSMLHYTTAAEPHVCAACGKNLRELR